MSLFPAYADVPAYPLVFPLFWGAAAFFALAMARHLRVFAAARPAGPGLLGELPRRVGGVVRYALLQTRMFRDRRAGVAAQGMRFFLVSLASLGANLLVLDLLISAGLGKLSAQAVAIVLVTPLNFVGNKLWSFRRRGA